jgi:hypothetical protein
MEVSNYRHSPAALTLEKELPVPIQDETGQGIRASLGVLERRIKKPSNLLEIEPRIV